MIAELGGFFFGAVLEISYPSKMEVRASPADL